MARENEAGTVDRVIALLRFISESEGFISIQAASIALRLPPSTIHRLFEKLTAQDLLIHERALHRYRMGPEFYRISSAVLARHPIHAIATPILHQITKLTDEVSVLGLLLPQQQRMIFALKVDSGKPLRYRLALNEPISLTVGASGRAILAFLPGAEIQRCLKNDPEVRKLAPSPSKAIALILKDLESIRRVGYAASHGARISEAVGFAVPVFGANGDVVGSLCITIPEQRYDPANRDTLISILLKRGQMLSETLGAKPAASPVKKKRSLFKATRLQK